MRRRKNLNLNSIDRFLKTSAQIHLEEYSSCETPSGCGGVVLRWINQDSPIAIDIVVRMSSKANIWLNGEPHHGRRQFIRKGWSVLAFEFSDSDSGPGLIQVSGKNRNHDLALLTLDDGSWKYTTIKPETNDSTNYRRPWLQGRQEKT